MTARLLTGDCRDVLPTLPAGSAQMCVTSPPYWGLRDYGVDGQLGLEDDPKDYLAHMVSIFRQVARVLRPDGTLWLNMGDCYTDGGSARGPDRGTSGLTNGGRWQQEANPPGRKQPKAKPFGLGRKQMIGMPWRVAFALQDDGWTLRSDIVWHKTNPMPESCTDRPTKAHEYLFLFSLERHYYYDRHAIAERASSTSHDRGGGVGPKARIPSGWDDREGSRHHEKLGRYSEHRKSRAQSRLRGKQNESYSSSITGLVATRNARSVWTIPTAPYKGAHFATFPPRLAERCILAGSSPHACQRCGAAYKRLTARERAAGKSSGNLVRKYRGEHGGNPESLTRSHQGFAVPWDAATDITVGWAAGCECVPPLLGGRCTVLDPFGGAGTVGLVSERLGRDSVLIDLNPKYTQMADERIDADAPLLREVKGA